MKDKSSHQAADAVLFQERMDLLGLVLHEEKPHRVKDHTISTSSKAKYILLSPLPV